MRKVELREGDAIHTEGLTDDQYHEVAKEFVDSGFRCGEYPDLEEKSRLKWFGVYGGELFHGSNIAFCWVHRELTYEQITGKFRVGNEPKKMIVVYKVVSDDNFESLKNDSDDLDKMDGEILDIDDPDVVMYDTEKNAFDYVECWLRTAKETPNEKPAFVVVIDNKITIVHREVKIIRHTA